MTGEPATTGAPNRDAWFHRPRTRTALRAAGLALIVAIACVRVARTWAVFSATADEPQHIAAGIEWWGRTDVVQHEPWRTVNPPVARIAVGLGPFLAGTQFDAVPARHAVHGPWIRAQPAAGAARRPALSGAGDRADVGARAARLRRGGRLDRGGRRLVHRRRSSDTRGWRRPTSRSPPPSCSRCWRCCGGSSSRRGDARFSAGWRWGSPPRPSSRRGAAGVRAGGGRRATEPGPAARNRAAHARSRAGDRALRVCRRVGRVSFRGRRAGVAVAAGLAGRHAARVSSVRGRRHAAEWLLAHRLPAPAAFLALFELCGQEAPGRSTSYLLGQLTPGRIPGVLPDRARGEDAAARHRAGGVRILRARASTRGDADARFRALAPVLAAAVFLAAVIRSRHNIGVRHVLPVMALVAMLAAHGAVDGVALAPLARRAPGRGRRGARVDRRDAVRDRARLLPLVQRPGRAAIPSAC